MWDCDELLGDLFFAWRLRELAGRHQVLWREPKDRPDCPEVRLAPELASGAVH